MDAKKKKVYQFNVRMDEDQYARLNAVADQIASVSRGQRPDFAEIVRSIIGWGNPELLTEIEKLFIAGDIPALHGQFPAVPKESASGKSKTVKS